MNETHWIDKLEIIVMIYLVPEEIFYEDKWYETCKKTEKTLCLEKIG